MVRICFDYGHGGRDSGAVYQGRKESVDNLSIGIDIANRVRIFGVEVDEIRTSDVSLGLKERCIFANKGKYDYFISFHRNAFKPEIGTGAETFVYTNASLKSRELAKEMQDALLACGFKNRGVKEANFYVLRETIMPAVLIEIGFIDNSIDNGLFDIKRKQIIQELTKSIVLNTK